MHAHGTGLFDDPLAAEIRLAFNSELNGGASVYVAAERLIQKHAEFIHDPDHAPVILFALAALQLDHGVVSLQLRKRVLTWINSGESIERWNSAPPEIVEARRAVEQELRVRLVAMG